MSTDLNCSCPCSAQFWCLALLLLSCSLLTSTVISAASAGRTYDQWNEDRLMARANQVIARDRPQGGVARERQVDQAVANLRERHNCTHGNWRYVPGSHRCEECYYQLPHYIFECRQCRILACQRCKMNRL